MATVKKKAAPKKRGAKKSPAKKKAVVRTRVNKKVVPRKKKDKNGGNRGNKKTVISRAMMKELESAAAIGCTYKEMAHAIGIGSDTLRRAREEQSGVQELIDAAKARGCVKAKNRLYQVATVPVGQFKPVNMTALTYYLNNNTEFSTQLELNDGTQLPKDVDVSDDEAVAAYLDMIKKPS